MEIINISENIDIADLKRKYLSRQTELEAKSSTLSCIEYTHSHFEVFRY